MEIYSKVLLSFLEGKDNHCLVMVTQKLFKVTKDGLDELGFITCCCPQNYKLHKERQQSQPYFLLYISSTFIIIIIKRRSPTRAWPLIRHEQDNDEGLSWLPPLDVEGCRAGFKVPAVSIQSAQTGKQLLLPEVILGSVKKLLENSVEEVTIS